MLYLSVKRKNLLGKKVRSTQLSASVTGLILLFVPFYFGSDFAGQEQLKE